MRKWFVPLVILAAMTPGVAAARGAAPEEPTCLLVNGGSGGVLTKSMVCVELANDGRVWSGEGSYAPADDTTAHWLTVTIEYRAGADAEWITSASGTLGSTGQLRVDASASVPTEATAVRACARAGTGGSTATPLASLCVPDS